MKKFPDLVRGFCVILLFVKALVFASPGEDVWQYLGLGIALMSWDLWRKQS